MLGRLFNSQSSTATSPSATRPSTATACENDEIHTRNLLYPDNISVSSSFHSAYSLANSQASSVSSAAASEHIDLDACRDLRVIIAQDASGSEIKSILYDSKPYIAPAPSTAAKDGACSPLLGRPQKPRDSAPTGVLTLENEMKVFTGCMFGSAPLAYKGPSTKVHILPAAEETKPTPSPAASRRSSLRSPPSAHNSQQQQPQHAQTAPKERRTTVLITRLFSVVVPSPTLPPTNMDGARNIPCTSKKEQTPTPVSSVGSTSGFPFPKMSGASNGMSAPKFVKPPKATMYAVGLVISLPSAAGPSPCVATSPVRCCYHKPQSSYDPDESHRHEYCCPTPPSFDEDYQSAPAGGIRMANGLDDFQPSSAAHDGSMSLVTKHWDVITRALSDLQRVAQARIIDYLAGAGIASPPQTGPPPPPGYKPRKRFELRRMALMQDDVVRAEVERLRWRVVSGIKVPRVIVGQGRWRIWKEEAKWANNRFGGRDMNFFFLTLLTAFLGHHTEWLDVLGPECYKRRHHQRLKARANSEDTAIPNRTVILSNDRIAARRLIYLLSAFLPAKPNQSLDMLPPPSRTSSINYLSQSPPVSTVLGGGTAVGGKIGSIRQKPRKKPSKLNMVSNEEDDLPGWDVRPSTPSGNSAANSSVLQLPLAQQATTKPGSTSTLTTLPSSATTVANVAPGSPQKNSLRPGSSGSSASLNLMSTLKRTGAANTSMDSNASGWSNFLSFWSAKSKSSATSDASEHLGESMHSMTSRTGDSMHSLMPREDEEEPVVVGEMYNDDEHPPLHTLYHRPSHFNPPMLADTPAPVTVDETDGTVDVDIPLGPLPFTSFSSPIASPPNTSWTFPPLPSLDAFSFGMVPPPSAHLPSAPADDDLSINVAGWIEDERFHPDFTLQAVKPYPELEADIKQAMRAEPTPQPTGLTPSDETGDRWVEVSSVLIADTKRMQIKRLRLRRRTRKISSGTPLVATPTPGLNQRAAAAPAITVYPDTLQDEDAIETELVCDVDDILGTAIERVLGVAGVAEPLDSGAGGESCKCTILGALEKVVGEVMLGKRQQQHWGGNVLTEGVRQWMEGIDETFV